MLYQRRGLAMIGWYAYLGFLWTAGALFSIGFIVGLRLDTPWNFERISVVAMLAVLAVHCVRVAILAGRWVRYSRTCSIELDDAGFTFRWRTEAARVGWNEVRGVESHTDLVQVDMFYGLKVPVETHTIHTNDGDYCFSDREIPGARKAAQAIAAHVA